MEETGQPYERVLTDISKGAQKTPEYLAINPMGKVPARPAFLRASTIAAG
jgi:glutathione S-transferase